jgi:NDP-sugar pyrophosphorylase family protein
MFSKITETGKFSVIQMYLRLANSESIYGYHDTSKHWMDLGKPDQLAKAKNII